MKISQINHQQSVKNWKSAFENFFSNQGIFFQKFRFQSIDKNSN